MTYGREKARDCSLFCEFMLDNNIFAAEGKAQIQNAFYRSSKPDQTWS